MCEHHSHRLHQLLNSVRKTYTLYWCQQQPHQGQPKQCCQPRRLARTVNRSGGQQVKQLSASVVSLLGSRASCCTHVCVISDVCMSVADQCYCRGRVGHPWQCLPLKCPLLLVQLCWPEFVPT